MEKAKFTTLVSLTLFTVLSIYGFSKYTNLVVASVVGFFAMMGGGLLGHHTPEKKNSRQVIAYGVGSGSMLASAAIILVPKSITATTLHGGAIGGFGIFFGYFLGYASHEFGHIFTHEENISKILYSIKTGELTIHAILAGSLMGVAYSTIPELSIAFGFGIIAHKFPAGFTTSLSEPKNNLSLLIIPATAVTIAGVTTATIMPEITGWVRAIVFGISAGVFSHVAIDMIPECISTDSHSHHSGHGAVVCSPNPDKQRQLAVASVLFGGTAITFLWYTLTSIV